MVHSYFVLTHHTFGIGLHLVEGCTPKPLLLIIIFYLFCFTFYIYLFLCCYPFFIIFSIITIYYLYHPYIYYPQLNYIYSYYIKVMSIPGIDYLYFVLTHYTCSIRLHFT